MEATDASDNAVLAELRDQLFKIGRGIAGIVGQPGYRSGGVSAKSRDLGYDVEHVAITIMQRNFFTKRFA